MKTDLTKVLAISGKHGLYEYVSQARNGSIVERIADKKRTCIDLRSRVTALSDVSIYTVDSEVKLAEVFEGMHKVLGDKDAPAGKKVSSDEIKAFFEEALPNYDKDRFYVSHMKKAIDWYNDLKNNASLDFLTEEELKAEAQAQAEADKAEANNDDKEAQA